MADLNFRIAATLDSGGFNNAAASIRGVGQASGEVSKAMEGTAAAVETVKSAVQGFLALEVVQFLKDIVNEAADAEMNEARLKLAVDNTGLSWEANKPKIEAFLDGMQTLTGVSKEQLTPALTQLVQRLGSVREAQEYLNLTVGVARGMQLDYASAADLVSGVVNNNTFALRQAAVAMGEDKDARKDSAQVLAELTRRYSDFADKAPAISKGVQGITNQWEAMKIELGTGLGPMVVFIGEELVRTLNVVLQAVRYIVDGTLGLIVGIGEGWLRLFGLVSPGAAKMAEDWHKSLLAINVDAAKTGKALHETLYGVSASDTSKNITKNLVEPTTKAFLEMNDAEKKIMADGATASAQSQAQKLADVMMNLERENAAVKQSLAEQDNWRRLSIKDQQALLDAADATTRQKLIAAVDAANQQQLEAQKKLIDAQLAEEAAGSAKYIELKKKEIDLETAAAKAHAQLTIQNQQQLDQALQTIDAQDTAERKKLYTNYYQMLGQAANQSGQDVGKALGDSLAGQKVNWRTTLTQIMQMIINTAVKAIEAYYQIGAANSIAQMGWAGVAAAAGLEAMGAAASAAVGSLSASPDSGGASIASSGSSTSSSSSTTATPAQAGIQVNIQGDMISDTAYIDRLAGALDSAVNNRDVRLTSTNSTTQGAVPKLTAGV